MGETKTVRVSYEPTGHGLALTLAESPADPGGDDGTGVLRVSDACVTLELPPVDGRTSVLVWDPAEVDWEALVA